MTNLPEGDPRHGLNGYSNLGCRCPICRLANSRNQSRARKRRNKDMLEGRVKVTHGKSSTYTNYGCRCQPCTDAHTLARHGSGYKKAKSDQLV